MGNFNIRIKLIRIRKVYTDQLDLYVEITHTNQVTQQHRVPGVPSTTNQLPPTHNTFTTTEAAPLSTMKNQHQKEKAKKKVNQANCKWKKPLNINLKTKKKGAGTFRELAIIAGCTSNNAGAPSITLVSPIPKDPDSSQILLRNSHWITRRYWITQKTMNTQARSSFIAKWKSHLFYSIALLCLRTWPYSYSLLHLYFFANII